MTLNDSETTPLCFCLALAQRPRRNGRTNYPSRSGGRELGQWVGDLADEKIAQVLAPVSTATCRGPVRMLMMKPARTSTIASTSNKKNVDVPAALTRRNSISMATNKSIDRT